MSTYYAIHLQNNPEGERSHQGFINTLQDRVTQVLWVFLGAGLRPDFSNKIYSKWNPFDRYLETVINIKTKQVCLM